MYDYERDGAAIYRQSFATIRAEADLSGLPDDVALVAVRAHPEDRPRPAEAGPNRLPPGVD